MSKESDKVQVVDSPYSYEETCKKLQESVKANKFGVLGNHVIDEMLKKKGIEDLTEKYQVFEVCNPQKANQVLSAETKFCMALPCRVAVWTENEQKKVCVGQIKPSALFSFFTVPKEKEAELGNVAGEVEGVLNKIIADTVAAPDTVAPEPTATEPTTTTTQQEQEKGEEAAASSAPAPAETEAVEESS